MAYFESSKLTDSSGNVVNPASDDSLTLLRRILILLKPLGIVTGNNSNRLSVDVGTATAVGTVGTITTVNTVAASTTVNQTNMGGVTAFDMMRSLSRTAYNQGIRSRLS